MNNKKIKEIIEKIKNTFNKIKTNPKILHTIIIGIIILVLATIIINVNINKKDSTEDKLSGYEVKIKINFIENLIFSKYDVKLYSENQSFILNHGEDTEVIFYLEKGKQTLTFKNNENSSIKKEIEINVESNMNLEYKISCYSNEIKVEKISIKSDKPLEENEVKINSNGNHFIGKDYKEVVKELKELGFTNIKEKPVYDIKLGITKENSVKKVKIGDKTDYIKGDKFKKDVKIVVTYHLKEEDDPSKAYAPYNSDNVFGFDYEKIEKAFKDAGFTNIKLKKVKTYEESNNGKVKDIEINNFEVFRYTLYNKDDELVIKYYVYEEKTVETETDTNSVYYSTNNSKQVKNGDSGVYSYIKTTKNDYDIYYIIDFNENYVYYFTDGEMGSATCDRLKITSGNLNSLLIITYNDGNTSWQEGLHFKYKNQPDHLIVEDGNHYEYDFYPTDLNSALSIRDSKRIVDY